MINTNEKSNIITYVSYGKTYRLELFRSTYATNNNLAIVAKDADTHELFNTVTVNTDHSFPENLACVDINNMPSIENALLESGIAEKTPMSLNPGGFVTYPVYRFNLALIPEM